MSIRCANYRYPETAHYHASVAEVRACCDASRGHYPAKAAVPLSGPSSQVKRPFNWEYADIPVGSYALWVPGGEETDGELTVKFYEVSRPEDGPWEGATFVAVMASDETYPVRGTAGRAILTQIQDDIPGALALYGHKKKRCGRCHYGLTHVRSRCAGYGKSCAEKYGYYYPSQAEAEAWEQANLDLVAA